MEIIALNRETFPRYQEQFAELYMLCFNVPMSAEEVKWRYMDNPYGEILSCVAVEDGKLVANYSASPIELLDKKERVKAAQSLNTMTHPDYAGKGLFVNLASRIYNHLRQNSYRMVLGFPNDLSNRTFVRKLGWHDISVMPTLMLNLDSIRLKPAPEMPIREDDRFDLNYERADYGDRIAIYRSNAYLRWRFAQHPSVKYHTLAVCADGKNASSRVTFKIFRDRINIVDFFFANEAEMHALMKPVVAFAKQQHKSLITLWADMGSWEHLALEGYGATQAAPVAYFGANVFDAMPHDSPYYDPRVWHLSMCDDNVY